MDKLLTCLFVCCSMIPLSAQDQRIQACQDLLDEAAAQERIYGITLTIIAPDGTEYPMAAGVADREADESMTPDSRMLLGSIGKMYVAASIMQLTEAGKLHLDDPLTKHLKEEWYQRIPNFGQLTVLHLLRHTSGIPRWVFDPQIWGDLKEDPDKIWSIKDRLAYVFDADSVHAPGEDWAYSDTNYIILGAILEKLTGTSFYAYVQEHLLDPYGLDQTSPSDQRELEGMVPGYTVMGQQLQLPEKLVEDGKYAFNPQLEWCGGGFVTTSTDLARWARQLYTGKVLSEQSTKLLMTPGEQTTELGKGVRYGFGTIVWADGRVGHTGFMPGYNSAVQYDPASGYAMAIQYNTDGPPREYSAGVILNKCLEFLQE